MKLSKLELSALLGIQARNRELVFMIEQAKLQLEQLTAESEELFSEVEMRLNMEPNTLTTYDVDVATGEIIPRKEGEIPVNSIPLKSNGHKPEDFEDSITVLEDVDYVDEN